MVRQRVFQKPCRTGRTPLRGATDRWLNTWDGHPNMDMFQPPRGSHPATLLQLTKSQDLLEPEHQARLQGKPRIESKGMGLRE